MSSPTDPEGFRPGPATLIRTLMTQIPNPFQFLGRVGTTTTTTALTPSTDRGMIAEALASEIQAGMEHLLHRFVGLSETELGTHPVLRAYTTHLCNSLGIHNEQTPSVVPLVAWVVARRVNQLYGVKAPTIRPVPLSLSPVPEILTLPMSLDQNTTTTTTVAVVPPSEVIDVDAPDSQCTTGGSQPPHDFPEISAAQEIPVEPEDVATPVVADEATVPGTGPQHKTAAKPRAPRPSRSREPKPTTEKQTSSKKKPAATVDPVDSTPSPAVKPPGRKRVRSSPPSKKAAATPDETQIPNNSHDSATHTVTKTKKKKQTHNAVPDTDQDQKTPINSENALPPPPSVPPPPPLVTVYV
jgi:hypothetical protein